MPGFGSSALLSICRQNSMGATAPGSWYAIPFANNGLAFTYGELTDDSIQQTPDLPDRAIGIGGFQGDIEFNLFPLPVGFFLRGLFGVASAEAVGSGFLHTFNPATAAWSPECTLAPYAFQVDPGEPSVNSAYLHQDGFINTAEFSIAAGGYARSRFGVMGKSIGLLTKAPGAAINPTGAAPLLWSGTSISFAGAAIQRFSNIRLAFDNKIAAQDRITGVKQHTFFFRDGFRDFGRMTGTVDLAQADWLTFFNGTEGRLVINCLGVTSISSGVNEYFKVDIPRMIYTAYPLNISGAGIVTAAVEGRAQYHSGSKTVCTITLCNTFASYAA
jgi:Phage tail tube protein